MGLEGYGSEFSQVADAMETAAGTVRNWSAGDDFTPGEVEVLEELQEAAESLALAVATLLEELEACRGKGVTGG